MGVIHVFSESVAEVVVVERARREETHIEDGFELKEARYDLLFVREA